MGVSARFGWVQFSLSHCNSVIPVCAQKRDPCTIGSRGSAVVAHERSPFQIVRFLSAATRSGGSDLVLVTHAPILSRPLTAGRRGDGGRGRFPTAATSRTAGFGPTARTSRVRLDGQTEAGDPLGYASRPFVLCGLPVKRPPAGTLIHERRNGRFLLQVTGHPNFGLPWGQDRLVPIFLGTLATRQQSATVTFPSAAEMLDTFGIGQGGTQYRRLVAAFERIFGATIFFGTDSQ
jgi:hypothetical protein